jgi:hypothetical protein
MIARYYGNTGFPSSKVTRIHNLGEGGGRRRGHGQPDALYGQWGKVPVIHVGKTWDIVVLRYTTQTPPLRGLVRWTAIASTAIKWYITLFDTAQVWPRHDETGRYRGIFRVQKDQDCKLHNKAVTAATTVDRVKCWYWCSVIYEWQTFRPLWTIIRH